MAAKVTIYSTTHCPYCKRAKDLFKNKGVAYDEVNLEEDPAKMTELKSKYNWRTVPMIVVNGKFIGGFDDLNKLDSSGELDKMLKA